METDNKIPMYILTQEQINNIVAIAGKEAVCERSRSRQRKNGQGKKIR